jgi:aldehyde:ferredoxin oxidoreductase
MDIGERIITTERMFNNREGFTRKDDRLPERFFKEPTPDGLSIVKGKKIDRVKFKEMINEYYDLHGWDENGVPNEETLRKLGLEKQQSNSMEK